MRLALIGTSSFIAQHVHRAARAASLDVVSLPHGSDLESSALNGATVVVNFALTPAFQTAPYTEENDADLRAARAAERHGAHFIMLSTRRVYPASARWNAAEDSPADGDETRYGQNKATSEAIIRNGANTKLAILRLSNIIGFEYELGHPRRTFMAMVLRGLRTEGKVSFDMNQETGRDFLPVEICANGIVRAALTGLTGTFNLGAGFPTACGDIAGAAIRGFGTGKVVVTNRESHDAFYLNTSNWNARFSSLFTRSDLMDYCEAMGRRLRDA